MKRPKIVPINKIMFKSSGYFKKSLTRIYYAIIRKETDKFKYLCQICTVRPFTFYEKKTAFGSAFEIRFPNCYC